MITMQNIESQASSDIISALPSAVPTQNQIIYQIVNTASIQSNQVSTLDNPILPVLYQSSQQNQNISDTKSTIFVQSVPYNINLLSSTFNQPISYYIPCNSSPVSYSLPCNIISSPKINQSTSTTNFHQSTPYMIINSELNTTNFNSPLPINSVVRITEESSIHSRRKKNSEFSCMVNSKHKVKTDDSLLPNDVQSPSYFHHSTICKNINTASNIRSLNSFPFNFPLFGNAIKSVTNQPNLYNDNQKNVIELNHEINPHNELSNINETSETITQFGDKTRNEIKLTDIQQTQVKNEPAEIFHNEFNLNKNRNESCVSEDLVKLIENVDSNNGIITKSNISSKINFDELENEYCSLENEKQSIVNTETNDEVDVKSSVPDKINNKICNEIDSVYIMESIKSELFYESEVEENTLEENHEQFSSTPWKCDYCDKYFLLKNQLNDHLVKFHKIKKIRLKQFKCNHCTAAFTTKYVLQNHLKLHTGEKQHKCVQCGGIFLTKTLLRNHSILHICKEPFICDHCGAKFPRKTYLSRHIKFHLGENPHKCNYCDSSFVQKNDLIRHLRIHTGEKPYECAFCGRSFTLRDTLIKHMVKHTCEKQYKCMHCDEAFPSEKKYMIHLAIHTGGKPFKCVYCPKAYAQRRDLKAHERSHTGEKPFKCDYCEATFTRKTVLKCHIRIHAAVKPFKCSYCDSSFAQKNNLINHMRKHTGERPFNCEYCSSSFRQKSYLKIHMYSHSGERPHKCNFCPLTFVRKYCLNKHLKIHCVPYKCNICKISFVYENNLVSHKKMHDFIPVEEKPCIS